MILWFNDGYRNYAICILVISAVSILISLYETYTNNENIRKMAMYQCSVNVMRHGDEGNLTQISSTELVPGDIVEIPE
jgi:cation-transporting ATPase 13A2